MIDKTLILEITRLKYLGWSDRKIARHLRVDRTTVKKYANDPLVRTKKPPPRGSILQPYGHLIDQWLDQDPRVSAPVVLQRLAQKGFSGKITVVRDRLRQLRGANKTRQAFMRVEPDPAEQMQIDWGHFGSLTYANSSRKLYALAVVEAYSRMLYIEFTHSQKQASLHQCLLNAFVFFGGTPRQIVVDNMLTAVVQRQGAMVRFNDAFLDFLRIFNITPVACNPGAPHEKGKVEAAIKYVRHNFWPLRSFADIHDVQRQGRQWLDSVANVRCHHGTGQLPVKRFANVKLKALPEPLPDCRQVEQLKVHKDFAVRFDANTYTAPPWTVGKRLTVKADCHSVTLYHQDKKLAVHHRCWQRHCRIESDAHRQQVKKLKNHLWHDKQVATFAGLGPDARCYLQGMLDTNVPIKKNVVKILALSTEYGPAAIVAAIQKALAFNAYGADYIENILYQQMTPLKRHLPVQLKNDDLNRIELSQPCLADYDAHVLKGIQKDDR